MCVCVVGAFKCMYVCVCACMCACVFVHVCMWICMCAHVLGNSVYAKTLILEVIFIKNASTN